MARSVCLLLGLAVLALAGCSRDSYPLLRRIDASSGAQGAPASQAAPAPVPSASGAAFPEPAHRVMDTAIGKVLATNRGMTLFTFTNDNGGGMAMATPMSSCVDGCAATWPPLIALDDARATGRWTVLVRPDGLKQWAYGGWPLYGQRDDHQPGDITGDGRANGAWKAARP